MLNFKVVLTVIYAIVTSTFFLSHHAHALDLDEIKKSGELRHIGIPYANFVIQYSQGGASVQEGLDVELMQGFAAHLGVKYSYVHATWSNAFGKLNGQNATYIKKRLNLGKRVPIEGDVISNGATILPWRSEVVDFSDEYFPSAVWLIARSDSTLHPIKPTGSIDADISAVKAMLNTHEVLAMRQSCLDPDLYNMDETGATVILPTKTRKLNEMVPAILNRDAESTLLDVPDILIALQKWPGEIKVIGPISQEQRMAVAFRKNSPELRKAFNDYFKKIKADGSYWKLVEKYYPNVFYYYADFFKGITPSI